MLLGSWKFRNVFDNDEHRINETLARRYRGAIFATSTEVEKEPFSRNGLSQFDTRSRQREETRFPIVSAVFKGFDFPNELTRPLARAASPQNPVPFYFATFERRRRLAPRAFRAHGRFVFYFSFSKLKIATHGTRVFQRCPRFSGISKTVNPMFENFCSVSSQLDTVELTLFGQRYLYFFANEFRFARRNRALE